VFEDDESRLVDFLILNATHVPIWTARENCCFTAIPAKTGVEGALKTE
jgi:hypothetical protein